MEIEFQNTETDFKTFYKFHFKNELLKRIVFLILFPLVMGSAVSGQPFEWTRFVLGIFIGGFLMLLAFYLVPYWISLKKFKKSILKEPGYLERKKLITTEEGLYFETATRNGTLQWESIVSCQSNEHFIYLSLADKRIYLIPKKAFASENDAINFLGIVQSGIIKKRGTAARISSTAQKPPYILGILGLIPLIGGFVGIGLILYGILKYKDKWLVLIGAAGIVVTVSFYLYLFYEFRDGEDTGKAFAQMSQSQLNNLMKDVEFYKMQNGVYPDSLAQIRKNNSMAGMYDPLLTRKGDDRNTEFNYERVGDKYYLFSSGIDGIPNTADDIYPAITDNDNKFGLIRK